MAGFINAAFSAATEKKKQNTPITRERKIAYYFFVPQRPVMGYPLAQTLKEFKELQGRRLLLGRRHEI